MSSLLYRWVGKFIDFNLQKMYEIAVDKMVERGFEPTSVKKIGGKIIFDVEKDELTGYEVEEIEADTTEEYVEKYIDAEVDQPRYKYDEDFETEDQKKSSPADDNKMILPGTKVDIEALEDWVMTTKINSDPVLQEARASVDMFVGGDGEVETALERAVDSTVFKVARKIYYVGRKPPYMTPEEWDQVILNERPTEPYSKNETSHPYGSDYKYRQGPIDEAEI